MTNNQSLNSSLLGLGGILQSGVHPVNFDNSFGSNMENINPDM